MNLKKYLSTGLALAGIGTWLALAPLLFTPRCNHRPTANMITEVRREGVNVLTLESQGSGVIFHKNDRTYILTAAHVLTDDENKPTADEIRVTQGTHTWTAVIVNCDVKRDLALLRLTSNRTVGRSAHLARRKEVFPIGTPLLHAGNPDGEHDSYVEGLLSGKQRIDGDFYQSTLPIYPGSSGGGVFTVDGQCIGLITRWTGPSLNFFIPHNLIWRWAVENDLQWLFQK